MKLRQEHLPTSSCWGSGLRVRVAPGGRPYFSRQDRSVGPGDALLHITTGIQRRADATLLAAAPELAEALFRLLTAPTLLDGPLDPETRAAAGVGWVLPVRAAPHLEIGADPPRPTSLERAVAMDWRHQQREHAMSDHDDNVRQLARYGSGVARLYLWVWICVCYLWVVFGVIGGLLIMNDGSKFFGVCVIAAGLTALKIAGYLKRLKNGGD